METQPDDEDQGNRPNDQAEAEAPSQEPAKFLTPLQPAHFIVLALCFGLIYRCTSERHSGWGESKTRAKVSRVKSDLRSLATGIEAYALDHAHFPTPQPDPGRTMPEGQPTSGTLVGKVPHTTTGALTGNQGVVYMNNSNFVDPFAPAKGAAFTYYVNDSGWMILSAGPDNDYDIDPPAHYDPSTSQPGELLLHRTYDPTNGTVSDGDIWRIRQ